MSLSISQVQERERGGAKEMAGEDRLLEERWRRVGMSESLRGRRSEEIPSRLLLPLGGWKLLSPRGDGGN